MNEVRLTNGVRLIQHEEGAPWHMYVRSDYVDQFTTKEEAEGVALERYSAVPLS